MKNTHQENVNILQSYKDDLQGTDWNIEYECEHGSIYYTEEDHPDDIWYFKLSTKVCKFTKYFRVDCEDDLNNFICGIIAQQDVQHEKDFQRTKASLVDNIKQYGEIIEQYDRMLTEIDSLKLEAKFTQV